MVPFTTLLGSFRLIYITGDFPYLDASSGKTAGFRAIVRELEGLGLGLSTTLADEQQSELLA